MIRTEMPWPGDCVDCEFELDASRILFEDHHLIVVDKPAPLLTQAPPGVPSLEMAVKQYIKIKYTKPAGVYLGIPHRLDRPVSGAIAFARNTKAAQRVHAQFHDRTTVKIYWAIVSGIPAEPTGIWEDGIVKLAEESRVELVPVGTTGSKPARLEYRVLVPWEGNALLELKPHTGRMHQLRAQAAHRGHAILGDERYGSTVPFGPPAEDPRERVIALHARQLTIVHPFREEAMTWTAPIPNYWPTWANQHER